MKHIDPKSIANTTLNLTQHPKTPEQEEAGCFDVDKYELVWLKAILTFDELPSRKEIKARAVKVAAFAKRQNVSHAMIGGAPFLMSVLEKELAKVGIQPLYAFSVRESIEETMPDGSVVKKAMFKHQGFIAPSVFNNSF